MMKRPNEKRVSYYWRCLTALVVVGVLLHVFHYKLYNGSIKPLAIPLTEYPRELGDWRVVSEGLDEEIETVLNLEDYWSATYARRSSESVAVFIGYYADEGVAKLHQPTVCYPGAGWTLKRTTRMEFRISDNPGESIEMNRLLAERGSERQIVLYWFHYPGATVADPSMSKFHRVSSFFRGDLNRSLVKVQIAVPLNGSVEATMRERAPVMRLIMAKLDEHLGPQWVAPR